MSIAAALFAAAVLLGYLHRYRENVNQSAAPMTVLVAKDLIEKGTPGSVIGTQSLFQASTLPRDEVKDGALTDPALLKGTVAAEDVYPGQQLTAADFTAGSDAVSTRVVKYERGMSVPFDAAHGMIGNVQTGDRIDVIAAFSAESTDGRASPVVRLLVQDILVLDAPEESATAGLANTAASTKNLVLRLTDEEATYVALAAEVGTLWVIVRPKSGPEQHVPTRVTLERLLLGLEPIPIRKETGGKPWSGGKG